MDMFQKIVAWNSERGLLDKEFDHTREASFILEELLESTGRYDSVSAREQALEQARVMIGDGTAETKTVVDAFADIIVFATGAIAKCGYDPSQVMEEVYKEISSRTGTLVDGKFVKDTQAIPYTAELERCRNK